MLARRARNDLVRQAETGDIELGYLQIVTTLPVPKRDTADVLIHVPVSNVGSAPEKGTLQANFEGGVGLTKSLTVSPGESTIVLIPEEFPQLNVAKPRL